MLDSVGAIIQPCLTPFVTSKVSCCEDHVYCISFFSESTLTFWDKSRLIKINIQAIQQNFVSIFPAIDRSGCHRLYDFLSACIVEIMNVSLTYFGTASFLYIQWNNSVSFTAMGSPAGRDCFHTWNFAR